ncbi:MAG: Ig-like domain-containing protein [Fibrobacteria bacterium]|nr:Ig-like domain-containing protein [Fibrobacteria bacterium]
MTLIEGDRLKVQDILLVRDLDNNGIYSPGIDKLLSANAVDSDSLIQFGPVGIDTINQNNTNSYVVLINFNSTPFIQADLFKLEIMNTAVHVTGLTSVTNLGVTGSLISSNTITRKVGDLALDTGAANGQIGGHAVTDQDSTPMLQFVLKTDNLEDMQIDSITVRMIMGDYTKIDQLVLVKEQNINGQFDPGVDSILGALPVNADSQVIFKNTLGFINSNSQSTYLVLLNLNGTILQPSDVFQFELASTRVHATGTKSMAGISVSGGLVHGSYLAWHQGSLSMTEGSNNSNLGGLAASSQDSITLLHFTVNATDPENINIDSLVFRMISGTGHHLAELQLVHDVDNNGSWNGAPDIILSTTGLNLADSLAIFTGTPIIPLAKNSDISLLLTLSLNADRFVQGETLQFALDTTSLFGTGQMSAMQVPVTGQNIVSPLLVAYEDTTAPAPLNDLIAVAVGDSQINLSWDIVTVPDADSIAIRYRTSSKGDSRIASPPATPDSGLALTILPASATSFIHTGLSENQVIAYSLFTKDTASNWSNPASAVGATYDITAPLVTVLPISTRDTTPELTGSIDDLSATIEVEVAGQLVVAKNNGDGSWTVSRSQLTRITDSTYDIRVTATDSVNNSATDKTTGELVIDATAPVVTVNTLLTNKRSPALSGMVNDPTAAIQIDVLAEQYPATNNGDGTWTLAEGTLAALADGIYNVVITVTDSLGNFSLDTSDGELVIDATLPVFTALTPADDTTGIDVSASLTMTFSENVWASEGQLNILRSRDNSVFRTYSLNSRSVSGAGTNAITITPDMPLEVGVDYYVLVDTNALMDTAGNYFPGITTTDAWNFSVFASNVGTEGDTVTGPDGITLFIPGGALSEPVPIAITAVEEDSSVDSSEQPGFRMAGKVYEFLPHGTRFSASVAVTVPYDKEAAAGQLDKLCIWWSNHPDSAWIAILGTVDTLAGTITAYINHFSFGVAGFDNIAPVVTVNQITTSDNTPQLSGKVDDISATVIIQVDSQSLKAIIHEDNSWTIPDSLLKPLTDGVYDIQVIGTDTWNNSGTDSTIDELILDATAPVITVNALYTTDIRPVLNGTIDDPKAVISVAVNNQSYTGLNNGDGSWTLSNDSLPALEQGVYSVEAAAIDSLGNRGADKTENELIIDYNDKPHFVAVPETLLAVQDDPFNFRPDFEDPDSADILTLAMSLIDSGMNWISLDSNKLFGTPVNEHVGSRMIMLTVTDGKLSDTVVITVIVENVNDAPTFIDRPDSLIAWEDSLFSLTLSYEDPDKNDSLVLSLEGPAWLNVTGNTLTGTPANSDVGQETITLIINDGELSDTLRTAFTVVNVNDNPYLAEMTGIDTIGQRWNEDQAYTFRIVIRDPDSEDNVLLDSASLPSFISLAAASQDSASFGFDFDVLPLQKDTGSHNLTFRFTDLQGALFELPVEVFVEETNDMPVAIIKGHKLSGGAVRFRLDVEDEDGSLAETRFHYQLVKNGTDTIRTGSDSTDLIDIFPLLDGEYHLLVKAEDGKGLMQDSAIRGDFTLSGISSVTADSGVWHMGGILMDNLNTSSLGNSTIYHWVDNGQSDDLFDKYITGDNLPTLQRGKGYWILTEKSISISVTESQLLRDDFSMDLVYGDLGWNQISNPFPYPVNVQNTGLTFWHWDTDSSDIVDADGILEPWNAYWVQVKKDTSITITAKPAFETGGLTKRTAISFDDISSWTGKLILRAGKYTDKENLFGVRSLAKQMGNENLYEPPKMGKHISLFFTGHNQSVTKRQYASDFRSTINTDEEWFEFGIMNFKSGQKTAELSLEGLESIRAAGFYTFLVDRNEATLITDETPPVLFKLSSEEHFYSVVITDNPNFASTLGLKFTVAQNVPNPVRFGTAFNFNLPREFDEQGRRLEVTYPVRITIYDILGRKVNVIYNEKLSAGSHSFYWRRSVSLPSGTYIYSLQAGKNIANKRMLLLR